jgi:uncharacterized membrane protein YkvA (DUF1232 family)
MCRGSYLMRFISNIVDWISTPYTIFLVLKDVSIPRTTKLRAGIGMAIIFAYVISPIDLIPDFIPFAGWLDDLIVVPLGFALLRKFTPGFNIVEKRNKAQKRVKRILFWTIFAVLGAILLFLAALGLLIYFIIRLITG